MKNHPQSSRKLFARRPGKRKIPQLLKRSLKLPNKPRRNLFRRFGCQRSPNFG
jgi:hypothetical protein